jgi:hypothetical protein
LYAVFSCSVMWAILIFAFAFGILVGIHRKWQVSNVAVASDCNYLR